MKKTVALLVASTALTAAVSVPAWSAMQTSTGDGVRPIAAMFQEGAHAMSFVLASDDGDHDRHRDGSRYGHDDDDDEGDDDCDDCSGARNPAPAGTVAPPQNGLFGNGTPPRVQVN